MSTPWTSTAFGRPIHSLRLLTGAAVPMLLAVGLTGCAIENAAPATEATLWPLPMEVYSPDTALFRQVPPAKAEALLTVRTIIPGVIEGDLSPATEKYYLKRNAGGWPYSHDTCTCACGGRGGYNASIGVGGDTLDQVIVKVSFSWTAPDGTRRHIDERLGVPWLGKARKRLPNGVRLSVQIQPLAG